MEYHEFSLNSYLVSGVKEVVALIGPRNASSFALMCCGYVFQKIVTFFEMYDLKTIWIGGKWLTKQLETNLKNKNKGDQLSNNETVICMIAFGTEGRRGIIDRFAEYLHSGRERKPSGELFFDCVYGKVLKIKDKKFQNVFEAVRWSPSAVNRQPWKILKFGNEYHFFTYPSSSFYSPLDIGIAIANFETACQELNTEGKFYRKVDVPLGVYPSSGCMYFLTWKRE